MATIQPVVISQEESDSEDFQPLTAVQAQALREKTPPLSVWRVVGAQLLVGLLVALVAGFFTQRSTVAISAFYGSLAVALPAALFARGLASKVNHIHPLAQAIGFLVWEGVKLILTAAMLMLAPKMISDLSWPALLTGLVVTLKVYWMALAWRRVFHLKVETKQN
ncbi:MAG: ATP synthase subunit I [Burkholderiaceae bacterium]